MNIKWERMKLREVEVITSKVLRSPPRLGWPLWNICVINDHGYVRLVGNTSSTSDTRRVNLVPNPVISHERGKDREVFPTSRTYPWSFMTQIFHNGQPSRGGDRKTFEVAVCPFVLFFGHCVVCSSSIYGFWLPLWYLQTLLRHNWLMRYWTFFYDKEFQIVLYLETHSDLYFF
jgi:hypothetical protein